MKKNREGRDAAAASGPIGKNTGASSAMIELLLFGGILMLMIVRFGGLFRAAELPGWDTPAHLLTLTQMAREYLPQGHVAGYFWGWLGGLPLFRFYAPLYFAVVAGFWRLTGGALPLALLFRASIFAAIFGLCVSSWFLARVYLGRPAARWAILLSGLLIFYPKLYSVIGFGAGAALWSGLVSGTVGISLLLVLLALLELYRTRGGRKIGAVLALTVAVLALTHTISYLVGGIFYAAFLIYHRRERRLIRDLVLLGSTGTAMASFWLLPFIAGLSLTSSEISSAANLPVNSFLLLFPFQIPYLIPGALGLLVAAVGGVLVLISQKRYFPVYLLAALGAVFLSRTLLPIFLPSFKFHYQRLLPFLFVLLLVAAAAFFQWLWSAWAVGSTRRRVYCALLAAMLLFNFFFTFDLMADAGQTAVSRLSAAWSWDDFPLARQADEVVELLRQRETRRILVQVPPADGLSLLGSLHYFSSRLPLVNGQSVITGLYVESSPLTPFIMPSVLGLTEGRELVHGDRRLRLVKPFILQGPAAHLERLKMFGVDTIVAYSPEFASTLASLLGGAEIGRVEPFRVYSVQGASALVRSEPRRPGIFFDAGGQAKFRDAAMMLYAGEKTFDFPLLDGGRAATATAEELAGCSVIVISGQRLAAPTLDIIRAAGRPVVFLGSAPAGVSDWPEATIIADLEVITALRQVRQEFYETWPDGWERFIGIMEKFAVRDPAAATSEPAVAVLNGWQVSYASAGPVILNGGYAPGWQVRNGNGRRVRQVSPALMYIDGAGDATLIYGRTAIDRVGLFLSAISALGLAWYALGPATVRLAGRRSAA
ncbi:MAG: hypothetical protein WCT10_01225 [Patescibacteria group bacterium]